MKTPEDDSQQPPKDKKKKEEEKLEIQVPSREEIGRKGREILEGDKGYYNLFYVDMAMVKNDQNTNIEYWLKVARRIAEGPMKDNPEDLAAYLFRDPKFIEKYKILLAFAVQGNIYISVFLKQRLMNIIFGKEN